MTVEFKFPCPACGQPVQADIHDCGSKVKCPACQAEIVVPQPDTATKPEYARGGHAIPVPKHAHAAPRASGVVPPPPPPPQMCKLAVLSFWLSVSSVLIWPLGFIPGILCGRKAKAEIQKNPTLGGRHLAKLGVAIGYGFAAIFGAGLVVFFLLFFNTSRKARAPIQPIASPSAPPVQEPAPSPAKVPEPENPAVGWTLSLTNMTIPSWTVSGMLHGAKFKYDHARVGTSVLIIRESTNTTDMTMVIYLNQKPGESLSGKKFAISSDSEPVLRQISIGWWENDKEEKQSASFTNGYTLKLEFGNVTRNKTTGSNTMAGAIYLCLPDTNYSYLAGTFDASILTPRPPGATPRGAPGSVPGSKKPKKIKKRP